jgi:tetratricopeptide (TPR) repeat protein
LLTGVALAGRTKPWMVLLAGRVEVNSYLPPDESLDHAIRLDPLDDVAASALLTSADQAAQMRPDQREAILARSGGNPLFLEQLAARADAAGTHELPDSLETLVATEIDALGPVDRTNVRIAAVLGPIFDASLLMNLIGATSVEQLLTGRLDRFLERVGDASVRFRNQTYRDVAYETLSFGRRRDLHGRALAAIEAAVVDPDEVSEVLSYHALHARDFERCWEYSRVAAAKAKENFANVEAAALFERALAAGASLGFDLAETWESLGDVSLVGGMFDKAKRAFDKARALGPHPAAVEARLCRKEALTAMQRGQTSAVTRWLNRGLAIVANAADDEELERRSDLRLTYAEVLLRRRHNEEAIGWTELAGQDAIASDSTPALARALTIRGLALLDVGRIHELDCLEEALHLWEKHGSVRDQATVATILGAVAYHTSRWDDATALFDRGRRDYERSGDVVTAGYGLCNRADILIDQGRGDEVVDDLHDVIRVWRSVGHPDPIPGALVNLGRCALERGDLEDAVAQFSEARALTSGSASARVETDYWLAECALRSGDATRCLSIIDEVLPAETATGGTFLTRLHRLRGLALASLGRFAEAIAEEETSIAIARERGAAFEMAQAVLALDACLAAEGSRADDALRAEAYGVLKDLGVRDVHLPLPA